MNFFLSMAIIFILGGLRSTETIFQSSKNTCHFYMCYFIVDIKNLMFTLEGSTLQRFFETQLNPEQCVKSKPQC